MKILITGGAGFIGSNLVKGFLDHPDTQLVRVLDNLSTGYLKNVEEFSSDPRFEFIQGDIRSYKTCLEACGGVDYISHQAALGSVPRSIEDPITTNEVNITGTLNVFNAARECKIKRLVYAASSSTYGDEKNLPKIEDRIGKPLSPYAVTKYVNELYADVYTRLFNMELIGLRYFNVFGPKQNPNGAYAAVIPLFVNAVINNSAPTINGDGSHTRDFTYIDNVVQANIKALLTNNVDAVGQVYNIAYGERTSLNQLFERLCELGSSNLKPVYGPERKGDVKDSLANIDKAKRLLGYNPKIGVKDGLTFTFEWYRNNKDTA